VFGGGWEREEIIACVLLSAAKSFASGREMVSGHFLFSAASGLYLTQQLTGSQERVVSVNMKILVSPGV